MEPKLLLMKLFKFNNKKFSDTSQNTAVHKTTSGFKQNETSDMNVSK